MKSESINELALALSKVQIEIRDAEIDAKNPHFKSDYATLEAILKAIRPVIGKHGLSITQIFEPYNDGMVMTTVLMHASGQWIKSTMPMKADLTKPQAVGSNCTYYRRYALGALVGITDTDPDDDSNEAEAESSNRPKTITKEQQAEINALLVNGDKAWFKEKLKVWKYTSEKDIESDKFDGMVNWIKQNRPSNQTKG